MKFFNQCLFVYIVLGLLSVFDPNSAKSNEQKNTEYIKGLRYDMNELLSLTLAPSSQPAPVNPYTKKSNAVIICTKNENKANSSLTENSLLDPSGGVIFPGAVVEENRQLAEGLPTPIVLPRAPIKVRVSLPGIGEKGERIIENPTNVTVPSAIDEILDYWLTTSNESKGYQPIARSFSEESKAYTTEQIGIELGFSAQWGSSNIASKLKSQSTSEKTIVMQTFKQVYFSVDVEEPQTAGSVFKDNVILTPQNMTNEAPPGFVRSVEYGRIIIAQMITHSAESKTEAELAMKHATLGLDLTAKDKKIVNNSQFKALILGGSAKDSAKLFEGDLKSVINVIKNGIEFSKDNPAYPISYKVADLKSRKLAKMSVTTDYIETECQEHPNGWVEFVHNGGYVAKFYLSYKSMDDQGQFQVHQENSGNVGLGWRRKYFLPGDASDIFIRVRAHGSLNPYPINESLPAIPNKCYKVWGTAFEPVGGDC